MSSSNQRLDLRTSLQGSSSFLQIESVNPDNFSFDANSQLNLSQNLTVQDLTLNGDFINNGGGAISGSSAEYSTSVTTPKLIFTDNLAEGLIIESSDGADYIVCNSTNGSEQINLKKKVFTDGNQIVLGTNGSRGILQYGNIKNSTIDNSNTLSASTTGTASAWSSTMRLDLTNPYSSQLMDFVSFDGTTDKEILARYIDESSSSQHRFVLQNTEAGHDSANLQTNIEFLNQYQSGMVRSDNKVAELKATAGQFYTVVYDTGHASNYSELRLAVDYPNDIPSFNNFVFWDTQRDGERFMKLVNLNTTYDDTEARKKYPTSIHFGNGGDFSDATTGNTFAKIKANWIAEGEGQLQLLARRTASSASQECGLIITASAGGGGLQGYQQANNMVIAGQQIDGFCDIKYFNGCAIGNSSHLGNGLEYKDSGGSVISGANSSYDATLELKLADDTLQTSGSGLSVKLKGSGGLQEATGNAGLEVKLKAGGNLDVDGNGLFVSGYYTDKIEDADADTFVKVEASADNDTIDFNVAGSNAMKIKSNGQVVVGSNITGTNTNNAVMTITDTRSGYVGIQHYYLQLGGDEYAQNSHVSLGFGYVSASSDTNVPPANIRFIETDSTGASGGYLALGCRETGGSGSYQDMTMVIKQGKVGLGGSDAPVINPQARLEIKSNSTDNLLRITGDDDQNAPFFDIASGTTYTSLRTGSGTECINMNHANQFVGIGTGGSPSYPLHIGSSNVNKYNPTGYYWLIQRNQSVLLNWAAFYWGVACHVDNSMAASDYFAFSDRRIKKDITLINDESALNRVNQLESYEYNYIDPLREKPMKTIGFIAQEVKEVIPNAVSIENDYIPDEIRIINEPKWTEYDGKYYLDIPDLDMSGNFTGRGRFFVSNDPSGNDEVCKEVNIKNIPSISINYVAEFEQSWNNVFFYGKEVDDFHILDKNQIFALHHSAIQELSRKNDLLMLENNGLLERTQVLEDKISSLESLINDISRRVAINETTLHGLIN